MKDKITYVAGGGGAPACYIHMGILKELIKADKKIVNWVGTSAGSIVGAYMACNLTKHGKFEIDDVDRLARTEFTGMKDINWQGLMSLYPSKLFGKVAINKIGMFKGEQLMRYLWDFTYGMQFKDLNDDMNLYITATEFLTGNLAIFSKEHTPNAYIADACRCSSGIQGAFIPYGVNAEDCQLFIGNSIKHPQNDTEHPWCSHDKILPKCGIKNNKRLYFVDGGNLGNCRTDIASNLQTDDDQIVGVTFTFTGQEITPVNSFIDVLGQTISLMMKGAEKLANKYTRLRDPDIIMLAPDKMDVGTTDFELEYSRKQELLDSGASSIKPYLQTD